MLFFENNNLENICGVSIFVKLTKLTPFMKIILNVFTLLALLILPLSCSDLFSLNNENQEDISPNEMTYICDNLGTADWDVLVYQDNQHSLLYKTTTEGSNIFSFIDGDKVFITENVIDSTVVVKTNNQEMIFVFSCDSVMIINNDGEISMVSIVQDDITENETKAILETKSYLNNKEMLVYLAGNIGGSIIPNIISKPFELMKYLIQTEDMNHYEKIDYFLDGKHNLIPPEWLDNLFDWAKENEPKTDTSVSYVVGITTGSASQISSNSVKAYVDGYLKATTNGDPIDFEFGICYSTSGTPSASGNTAKSNVNLPISIAMPHPFVLNGLSQGIYYYRAYFKNHSDGKVYYGTTKQFTVVAAPTITSYSKISETVNGTKITFNISASAHNDNGASTKKWGVRVYLDDSKIRETILSNDSTNGSCSLSFYGTYDTMNNDYSSFEASTRGHYYISAFAIMNDGAELEDKQDLSVEYKIKPSFRFTSASVGSTDTWTEGEGEDAYDRARTSYSFTGEIKGVYWMKSMQYTLTDSNVNNNWSADSPTYDGYYNVDSASATYTVGDAPNYSTYYTITLRNGSTIRSSNSLQYSGGSYLTSISVSGASYSMTKSSYNNMGIQREMNNTDSQSICAAK